jgi:WD40 repeat protein
MLVGVRCGEIFEAKITDSDNRMTHEKMEALNRGGNQIYKQNTLLKIEFMTYVSSHSSLHMNQNQKKIAVAIYPKFPVLASVGDDETLRLWDMDRKTLWLSKNLGTQATNLAFSPEGGFLIIGLVNGVTLILECIIAQLPNGI